MGSWKECQLSNIFLKQSSDLKKGSIHLSFFISFLSFSTCNNDIWDSVSQLGSRTSITFPHSVKSKKQNTLEGNFLSQSCAQVITGLYNLDWGNNNKNWSTRCYKTKIKEKAMANQMKGNTLKSQWELRVKTRKLPIVSRKKGRQLSHELSLFCI